MIYILFVWLLSPIWFSIALFRKIFLKSPSKVLFMEIAGIGDVVCSAVIFREFKAAYPNAKIDLILDPVALNLAPLIPMIDNIICFAYKGQKGFRGRLRLAAICARYDVVICLIPSAAQLSAMCLGCVPNRYSVLPSQASSTYSALKPLLSAFVSHNDGDFFIASQAKLLKNFLRLQDLNEDTLDKWLPNQNIAKDKILQNDINYVGVLVSSARELKRIPVVNMCKLINSLLAKRSNTTVILIGGTQDKQIANEILECCGDDKIIDTTGKYSLNELPNLLIGLGLFVGVDSGVTHIADALGLDVVCIGGPVDLDEVYKNKSKIARITTNIQCYPCSYIFDTPSVCKTKTLDCIKKIDITYCTKLLKIS